MTTDDLNIIEGYLDAVLRNQPLAPHDGPEGLAGIRERFLKLSEQLEALQRFASQLYTGDVQADPPPRDHYIAAGLKQLQAQLLHLTWQAQRVAEGDYSQRVDFMGDFSQAFNEMVDQLHQRETKLKQTQTAMERVFNLIEPILVVGNRGQGEILYVNEMAAHRFGVTGGAIMQDTPITRLIQALTPAEAEQETFDPERHRWYGITVRELAWGRESNAHLYYCRDITSYKMRESSLDVVANTDELTGINNRRAFDHAFAKQWNVCLNAQKPLSIIIFDIDHFKQVNDNWGHLNGDKLLCEFAHILKHSIARSDDIVARYGGEEFIAALAFTDEKSALRIAKTICQLTEKRVLSLRNYDGQLIDAHITVSCGVSSVVPSEGTLPSKLIRAADIAMYQAKKSGRNRACYQPVSDNVPIDCLPEDPRD